MQGIQILPNVAFWSANQTEAFVRVAGKDDRFVLCSAALDGSQWLVDFDAKVYLTLKGLVGLFSEVGLEHDREAEINLGEHARTAFATGNGGTGPVGTFRALLQSMLGRYWNLKDWLVSIGRPATVLHRKNWDALYNDVECYDLFEGERCLLQLLESGRRLVPIRAGDKELRHAPEGFYFSGSAEWNPEEMITMMLFILSDEALNGTFEEQWGPFLVNPLRPLRGPIAEETAAAMSAALGLTGESEAADPQAAHEPATADEQPLAEPQQHDIAPTAAEPSFYDRVLAAGERAVASEDALAAGLPALREQLESILRRTGLS